jgi:hypothetical protein
MRQFIEVTAAQIGAVIQNACANVDFEIVSLPGGSLIAVVLWLYAIAMGSIRRTLTKNRCPPRSGKRGAGKDNSQHHHPHCGTYSGKVSDERTDHHADGDYNTHSHLPDCCGSAQCIHRDGPLAGW